ncbi:MAG: motility protein A [Dehalococcoidia bacterium]
MDLGTIIGIVGGIAVMLMGMMLGSNPIIFVHVPSILIVIGGSISATLIAYPLADVLGVFGTVRNAFMQSTTSPTEIIQTLVAYATKARREGILTLESEVESAGDLFLAQGVRLAIDGTAPELIKDILITELTYVESRHATGQGVLNKVGELAPAFGMIGTLIGLVQMLKTMEDPSQIGAGMATALLTTFYGAVLANFLAIPLASKLKNRTETEILAKEVIIEGILSIQSGDNPRVVEQKLKAFISPKLRDAITVEGR